MGFEHAADDVDEEAFGEGHEAVQVEVGDLGLDHPEFCEVTAGFGFFGAEGGAEAVDLAERHGGGFEIELAGLGEVGLFVFEVVHLEEFGGAFAGVGSQDRRVGAGEGVDIKILSSRAHDGGADAKDGGLARGAEPEVAMLHEEVDAVLFAGYGVGAVVGDALGDGDADDVELDAGGGALVGADLAGDDEGGLEREAFEGGEGFFRHLRLGDDALDGAGAVAEGGEEELAGGAEVVEPAAQGDGFADVLGELGDGAERGLLAGRLGRGVGVRLGAGCGAHVEVDFSPV